MISSSLHSVQPFTSPCDPSRLELSLPSIAIAGVIPVVEFGEVLRLNSTIRKSLGQYLKSLLASLKSLLPCDFLWLLGFA